MLHIVCVNRKKNVGLRIKSVPLSNWTEGINYYLCSTNMLKQTLLFMQTHTLQFRRVTYMSLIFTYLNHMFKYYSMILCISTRLVYLTMLNIYLSGRKQQVLACMLLYYSHFSYLRFLIFVVMLLQCSRNAGCHACKNITLDSNATVLLVTALLFAEW